MKKLNKNKVLLKTIFFLLVTCILAGCSKEKKLQNKETVSVVTTIFPIFDWTRNLCKGITGINIEMLSKNGTDLHSFQPSAADIIKISQSDLFIFIGGESDSWIKDVLKTSGNKNQLVLNLTEILKDELKEEESVEGMEEHHHHEEEEDADFDHIEYDEHLWLSVKNAKIACTKIAEALELIDLGNSALIAENLVSYNQQLSLLENEILSLKPLCKGKSIIVCDRFPFRYMTEELGLKYFAAFTGCSAETEASFETLAFLAKKVSSEKPKAVFVTESSDLKLSGSVLQSAKADIPVYRLNSMQSVTLKNALLPEDKGGERFISIMKDNLSKIRYVVE